MSYEGSTGRAVRLVALGLIIGLGGWWAGTHWGPRNTAGVRHSHSGGGTPASTPCFGGFVRSHALPASRTPMSGGPRITIDALGAAARMRAIVSS